MIEIRSSTPPCIGAIQFMTADGPSAPQLVLIDPLPGVPTSETNSRPATAQRLVFPAAVDGICQSMKADYFTVKAGKGTRLAIEAVAQRMGSRLDPRLRLLDPSGRELEVVDDSPGLGADCAIHFVAPATGDYVIELRDSAHEGGRDHRYRMRVDESTLPRLDFNAESIPAELIEAGMPEWASVREREPSDTSERAQPVSVPVAIDGGFSRPREVDFYEFDVGEGQRVSICGRTRSLGFEGDLRLVLQDEAGKKVAEAGTSEASDPCLTNLFRKGGTYRLRVNELNDGAGPNFGYRIEIQSPPPVLVLTVDASTVAAPPGGTFELSVKPERRGYEGPITLSLAGLGQGFEMTNHVITTKTNAIKLSVRLPGHLKPGELWHFVILGRGEGEGAQQLVRVSTRPALRRIFPDLRHPPAALDGLIALGVTAPAK